MEIVAFVSSIGNQYLYPPTPEHPSSSTNPEYLHLLDTITRETVDTFQPVRCPEASAAQRMEALVSDFKEREDSIGGTVTCVIRNVPSGLGEPCFDKLEASLAHSMLSIPATKGFEIGSGFAGTQIPGSIHNDAFVRTVADDTQPLPAPDRAAPARPKLTTRTNHSGGIQGGISNGAPIYFNVAFKPPATIGQAQTTTSYGLEEGVLEAKGRHDPCVVPRAVPIVEAMAALVVMDAVMAQLGRSAARELLPAVQGREVLRGLPVPTETPKV